MSAKTRKPTIAERFDRLPKWAQSYINSLEIDLASARAKLAAGPKGSLAWSDPYSESPRPLGPHPHVDFQVTRPAMYAKTRNDDAHFKINVRLLSDGTLQVMGSHTLSIEPRSSNLIWLSLAR